VRKCNASGDTYVRAQTVWSREITRNFASSMHFRLPRPRLVAPTAGTVLILTLSHSQIRTRAAAFTLSAVLLLTSLPCLALAQESAPDDTGALQPVESTQPSRSAEQTQSSVAPVVAAPTEADIASHVTASVVQVLTADGAGSGISVAAGVLTNEHVVRGSNRVDLFTMGHVLVRPW
jgi:hypothetical protein